MKCETNKLKLQSTFNPISTTGDIAVDASSRARAQVARRRLLVIPLIDDNLAGQVKHSEIRKKGCKLYKGNRNDNKQPELRRHFAGDLEIKQNENEDSNFYEFVIVLKRQ